MRFKDAMDIYFFRTKSSLMRAMAIRFEFLSGLLLSFLISFAGPLFQMLIYANTKGYPGWNLNQIILFQGVMLFWIGFSKTFFGDIRPLVTLLVKHGLFDRILLNPVPPLVMLLTHGFGYQSIGALGAGIIVTTFGLLKTGIGANWWQLIFFPVFLFAGILLHLAFIITFCSLTLRFVHIIRLGDILDRISSFGTYPAEIFSGVTQFIYLAILPVGIWIYYPSQALLGRIPFTAVLAIGVCGVIFALSLLLWSSQIKKYASAGG